MWRCFCHIPVISFAMLKLTNRLKQVADFVEPCDCMADIGTDHAYLPAWLILQGVVKRAIASDIHPLPLQNAQKTVGQYGLQDRIALRLSDGLTEFSPRDGVQTFVFAGMGGELIADMLSSTPWLCTPQTDLVLQPMTHFEDVRRALGKCGFTIVSEAAAAEGKRLYLVIRAKYSGEVRDFPEWFCYAGLLPKSEAQTDRMLLQKILARLQKKADALRAVEAVESARLSSLIKEIQNESC